MKIAIFTNNYLPNPYGVSSSIESFRRELERLGHTVYIFAPKAEGFVDENKNVFRYPAIDLKFKNVRFPIPIPFSFKIRGVLSDLKIDIIHSQHPNLLGWEAKRWAKKKNVPLVFTWHTLYDQYAHFAPFFIPKKIASWWAIRNAVRYANSANQIVVPTPSVKKIIVDWGVANKNIIAIPTGVEVEFFAGSDRQSARKKMGIMGDEKALLLVSRLTAEKNVEFLVSIVLAVMKKKPKTKFILAGGGSEFLKLKNMIFEAGMSSRVIFEGIVSRNKMKNIYAAGDIFVYASKSETQGMVLTEAMYMGLPIVAVNATGAKDIVGNQVTGILVRENMKDFVRAIERLLGDENLCKKFSENAKKSAIENYISKVCAEKMLAVYTSSVERK